MSVFISKPNELCFCFDKSYDYDNVVFKVYFIKKLRVVKEQCKENRNGIVDKEKNKMFYISVIFV